MQQQRFLAHFHIVTGIMYYLHEVESVFCVALEFGKEFPFSSYVKFLPDFLVSNPAYLQVDSTPFSMDSASATCSLNRISLLSLLASILFILFPAFYDNEFRLNKRIILREKKKRVPVESCQNLIS